MNTIWLIIIRITKMCKQSNDEIKDTKRTDIDTAVDQVLQIRCHYVSPSRVLEAHMSTSTDRSGTED